MTDEIVGNFFLNLLNTEREAAFKTSGLELRNSHY